MFLYNCWYAAAWDHEVADGGMLSRTFLEQPVVIYRGESGRYVALDDRCCHRAAPLSLGRVEGDCIRCLYHGMKYDPDGACVEIPGQDRISSKHRVRSYPLEERGHLLWIWMGDPALANNGDIPDYEPLSNPAWQGLPTPAYMHYDANWLLIVDNLSDFSHLAWVHTNTLGGSEEYAYKTHSQVIDEIEGGFGFERWHRDSAPPPYHARVSPEGDAQVDRCNIVKMLIPGVFFMETTFTPAGIDSADPANDKVRRYRNCQYMTPETRSTSHFFWNYLRDYEHDDLSISESLQAALLEGFMEDKVLIEAQQKLLEIEEPFQPRALAADGLFMNFRQELERRIAEERKTWPPEPAPTRNPIL
jgi:vanillate O-demethylase monooxygenase subunit